jgi:hypothetical protein
MVWLAAGVILVAAPAAGSESTQNLIKNGGAEDSPGISCKADTGYAAPAGWQVTNGLAVLQNDCSFPLSGVAGSQFFAGGDRKGVSSASQGVDLYPYAAAIDGGATRATLSGLLGGYQSQRDYAWVGVTFLDQAGNSLPGGLKIGPVTAADRGNQSTLLSRSATGAVPRLSRRARVVLSAQYFDGAVDNDGYADNISLTLQLGAPSPTPPPATGPVPIGTVSNGCGGEGWEAVVRAQNYLGNTSKYADSNINPLARTYTVSFKDACDLHDAGYAGAVVRDKLNGNRIVDFRTWSRKRVDDKFLQDLRWLCAHSGIPATARTALANCKADGGNFSVGAHSRYNFVRCFGDRFFDADLSKPGTQRTGPRQNDRIPILSRECRFKK